MNFVKDSRFTMGNRTFLILSGMVHDNSLPAYTPKNQVGNCIEFIEIDPNRTYVDVFGRTRSVSFAPKLIAAPKNDIERKYNEYASELKTYVRDKELMYSLLERGEIILL